MQPRKHKITILPTPDSPRTVATLAVFDAETFTRIVRINVCRRGDRLSALLDAVCVMNGVPSPDGLGFWNICLHRPENDFAVLMLLADVLGYPNMVNGEWTREFRAAIDLFDAMKAAEPARSAA